MEVDGYFLLIYASVFLFCSGCYALGRRLWKLRWWAKRWKLRVQEEERREALRIKGEMEALISCPGWKRLVAAAEAQTKMRMNEVMLKPTTNPYEQEYQKGEVQGIRTFTEIPQALIEQAKAIIELEKEEDARQ